MQTSACILNSGQNAWAFQPVADAISAATGIPVQDKPRKKNYLLGCDALPTDAIDHQYFVELEAIRVASDKRLIADAFQREKVPSPQTFLFESLPKAKAFAERHASIRWCLKYPDSCGGAGHRLLEQFDTLPDEWPKPLILQEFIEMDIPAVYRTYAIGGNLCGWVVRKFPENAKTSPWVAHARGARYEQCGALPAQARDAAEKALEATGLTRSFGCVDLIQNPLGQWLALEVGTDGWMSHVDRDIGNAPLESEILNRLSDALAQFVTAT